MLLFLGANDPWERPSRREAGACSGNWGTGVRDSVERQTTKVASPVSPRDALRTPYLESVVEIAFDAGTVLVTPAPAGVTDGRFPAGLSHLHVITAWNPFSQVLDAASNAARNEALARNIESAGLVHLDAVGRSPDHAWREQGFAVLDADEDTVLDLAERHDQHAVYAWTPREWAVVWAGDHRGERDVSGWRVRG